MFNCVILKRNDRIIGIFPSIELAEAARDALKVHWSVSKHDTWWIDWSYIEGLPF